MIRVAEESDRDALKTIWRECFPEDTEAGIARFFNLVWKPSETFVYEYNGVAVSAVYLLPVRLHSHGRITAAQYIYAAGTLRNYRGKGFFGRLLTEADAYGKSAGRSASFLLPAEPELYNYYARFGYEPYFFHNSKSISFHEVKASSVITVKWTSFTGNYMTERNAKLSSLACWVEWGSQELEFAFYGGNCSLWQSDAGGFAFAECSGQTAVVKEALCTDEQLSPLAETLVSSCGCKSVVIRCPCNGAAIKPFGMARFFDQSLQNHGDDLPYLGLALD